MEELSLMKSFPAYVSGPGRSRNYGECHVVFFSSSGNMISDSVSNFRGLECLVYCTSGSVVSLCDSDFQGESAVLFFCRPVRTLSPQLQIYL
jgi:hypothetical protein